MIGRDAGNFYTAGENSNENSSIFHREQRLEEDVHLQNAGGERVMSFGLYLLGYILFVIGVAYGAHMANVPANWIGVVVIALIGIGIMTGVSRTRMRDPQ
jgi:hypothetical protein